MTHTVTYKRYLNKKLLTHENSWFEDHYISKSLSHYWASSGRGALEYLFKTISHYSGTAILVPAIMPEGLVLPLNRCKIRPIAYHIDENMEPDIDDIKLLVKNIPDIHLIIVINYFGKECLTEAKAKELQNIGLYIIEDCAQSLCSSDSGGNLLGFKGDIALFSLPKSLPVPNGCLILIHNPVFQSLLLERPVTYYQTLLSFLASFFVSQHLLWKKIQMSIGRFRLIPHIISSLLYMAYYKCVCLQKNPARVSKQTLAFIKRFDFEKFINLRRQNALQVHESLLELGITNPILSNVDNSILTGYPLMVADRGKVKRQLASEGIECLTYKNSWYLLSCFNGTNGIEQEIFENHILFPISENCSPQDINRLTAALKDVLNEKER